MKKIYWVAFLILSIQANASISPTFTIAGKVGNLSPNTVQLITQDGHTQTYPRSIFSKEQNLRPGMFVREVVRFDSLGKLYTKTHTRASR